MQHAISERTTRQSLVKDGLLRPHRVPVRSAKIFTWSDESWFLLRYADYRVRIGRKQHESMAPSCLVSTVQAGGGDVGNVFLAHVRSLDANLSKVSMSGIIQAVLNAKGSPTWY